MLRAPGQWTEDVAGKPAAHDLEAADLGNSWEWIHQNSIQTLGKGLRGARCKSFEQRTGATIRVGNVIGLVKGNLTEAKRQKTCKDSSRLIPGSKCNRGGAPHLLVDFQPSALW
jgi:hypothetical protein